MTGDFDENNRERVSVIEVVSNKDGRTNKRQSNEEMDVKVWLEEMNSSRENHFQLWDAWHTYLGLVDPVKLEEEYFAQSHLTK